MFETIHDEAELSRLIASEPAVLAYFSAPECNVCQMLKPKIADLLAEEFPRVRAVYVDCSKHRAACAQQQVFGIPTVAVWLDGREHLRRVRNFSVGELRDALARPYEMLFE